MRLRASDLQASLVAGAIPTTIAVPLDDTGLAQIVDATGKVVRSSPNIDGEPLIANFAPATVGDRITTLSALPIGDGNFRVLARRVRTPTAMFTLYVGTSTNPITVGVRTLSNTMLIVGPALFAIVVALAWLLIGRALGALDAIRAEVEMLHGKRLGERVRETGNRDEVDRLAHTMNALLDRLETSNDAQRRFVADASHELRSPLTAMRAELEIDREDMSPNSYAESRRELLDEVRRMQRLVEDLLALARADAPAAHYERRLFDLDDVVLEEVRRLRIRGRVHIDARRVNAVQTIGERETIRRAIRNVLDNAERHADRHVIVALDDRGGAARVVIEDDGNGIPTGEEEHIFERFARTDAARDRDRGGTGLGLAIVREIVDAHGGTATAETVSQRGARFTHTFPNE